MYDNFAVFMSIKGWLVRVYRLKRKRMNVVTQREMVDQSNGQTRVQKTHNYS